MAQVVLPPGVVDYAVIRDIHIDRPDLPAELPCVSFVVPTIGTITPGHCYASEGGSGLPQRVKVVPLGRGGVFEVWELTVNKQDVLRKMLMLRCQYCQKYLSHGDLPL
jgi:hypothetical protein